MRVITHSKELQPGSQKVCAAIGVFDGLHLGHQQVIRKTLADALQWEALSVVITFDRHPSALLAPDKAPPMIYTNARRLRTLEDMGVDATWLIPFDAPFSQTPGDVFIRGLAADFSPLHSLSVGIDFAFGHRRSGNVGVLQVLGKELGFVVHGLASVALDGEIVSSTRIRHAIQSGRLDAADQMLGRPWSLSGRVVHGEHLGRRLGFPTANLAVTGLTLPPNGVYAAHVRVRGVDHRSVLNIGHRPTVSEGATSLRVEAHLLHFTQDIYGEEVEVFFIERLRDEMRFGSLELLQAQIALDIRKAEGLFE
ncbi:MAG: bifunctional riboflavin kinase/FAD synthetase [Verrucomicrobia bacterium]|nr:bifunctional riboflavin kinase/FAD synthetase [Verrucomicrobiota bacterium]MBI3869268.1 bifunctional riboflavin kinase/FAD synthetase [Verrucomicrobiota bacterium]